MLEHLCFVKSYFTNIQNLYICILTWNKSGIYYVRMNIEFQDEEYERLAFDLTYLGNRSASLVTLYRNRINRIKSAINRLDLYALKSLRLEKLKGKRQSQHSMRLNDQYRLIVEFMKGNEGETVRIIKIEDYH